MTKYLINEQYDVEDAGATKGFGKGEAREDYADAWADTGNIVLIGLRGSGKRALAELLAARTGLPVLVPDSAAQALEVLGGEKKIVVLSDDLVEDETVQPRIHGSGKVFYLMADSNTLSARIAGGASESEREQVWRDLSARLACLEPAFYSVLHFILQAAQSPEEMMEDALEKIAF